MDKEYAPRRDTTERKFVMLLDVRHYAIAHPYWTDRTREGRPPTYIYEIAGRRQTYVWDRDLQCVRVG